MRVSGKSEKPTTVRLRLHFGRLRMGNAIFTARGEHRRQMTMPVSLILELREKIHASLSDRK